MYIVRSTNATKRRCLGSTKPGKKWHKKKPSGWVFFVFKCNCLLCCFSVFIRKTRWTCTHFFKNTWWNRNLVGGHALFQYCHRIASGWVGLPSIYQSSLAAISKVAYIYDLAKIQSSHLLPGATFEKSSDFLSPQSGSHLWLKCIVLLGIHSFIRNCGTSPCSIRGCLGFCGFLFTFWVFLKGVFVTWTDIFFIWNAKMLQCSCIRCSAPAVTSFFFLILTLGRTKDDKRGSLFFTGFATKIHGILLNDYPPFLNHLHLPFHFCICLALGYLLCLQCANNIETSIVRLYDLI